MWREATALWSMATLLLSPVTPEAVRLPAAAQGSLPSVVLPLTVQTAITPDMVIPFNECLREMAQQIKEQFADEIVARHPLFRTPIRMRDSRVTLDKIVEKLQEKTQSYVQKGGGMEIDLTWDSQHRSWSFSGYRLWWKDSKTGKVCRQYAKNLHELRSYACGDNS